MAMPNVNITFSEKAKTLIKRGERGVVALILRDEAELEKNPVEIITAGDVPEGLSEANKAEIERTLKGYVNAPKKVIAYVIKAEDDYTDALAYFEVNMFDYLVIPTVATDSKTSEVVAWIKNQRKADRTVKAVLPNVAADVEGVVNYATASVTEGTEEFTAEEYCGRIAGIIAGTPLTMSCTYAPIPELTNCTRLNKEAMDAAVEAGKLIVFHDGEKVKIARGINSLTTTTPEKGDQFKKIKIVETMDMIHDDLKKAAEDSYIGKYPNSYDNKCLLLSAVSEYLNALIKDGILSSAEIGIDPDANKEYLDAAGVDTSSMSDDDLKKADTGDQVFMNAKVKILDAMEDITLTIAI